MAYRRDRGRDRHHFDDQLLGQIAEAAEQATKDASQRMNCLMTCLDKLSESQRELLSDRYGKQVSVKELAKSVGRSPAALGMTLYRVRRLLLDCIELKLQSEGNSA